MRDVTTDRWWMRWLNCRDLRGAFSRAPSIGLSAWLIFMMGCSDGQDAIQAGTPDSLASQIETAHGIPEHKPRSFQQAVQELADRLQAYQPPSTGNAQRPPPQELQVLSDIVKWMPELAADSDLKRADWEHIQRTANHLAIQIESWSRTQNALTEEEFDRFRASIAELTPLAEKPPAYGPRPAGSQPASEMKRPEDPNLTVH